jgi:type VI secretion system protein ImpA
MAFVPILDVEAMLKPISADKPSGVDVKDGKSFEMLKEARREEEAISQGEWKREVKVADWPKVVQLSTKILTTESKDLQVAAWLVEGLVKRHGFAGLRDGLSVINGLHVRFWDSLYPVIEAGDLEFRSGRLEALNKILPISIRNVPLIHPPGGAVYSYRHYKESQEVENLRRGAESDSVKRSQLADALEEGKLEGEKFDKAVVGTPLTHCTAILENIAQSWEEFERLDHVLEDKYGQDAPSLRLVKEAIGECRALMDGIVKRKGGVGLSSTAPTPEVPEEASMATVSATTTFSGGIEPRDRPEALRRLAAVAEFFRKTEPHSPVSYLVQRAARWGEMPLEEWLQEVIKSQDVLGEVRETLGIKQASTTTES